MEFLETRTFTRLVVDLMDDEYARLQTVLALRPDLGRVIPGGGGVRKMRWAGSGHGKRGGLRLICYWQPGAGRIWMLLAYPKSERDDLSAEQVRQLRILVKEFLA